MRPGDCGPGLLAARQDAGVARGSCPDQAIISTAARPVYPFVFFCASRKTAFIRCATMSSSPGFIMKGVTLNPYG